MNHSVVTQNDRPLKVAIPALWGHFIEHQNEKSTAYDSAIFYELGAISSFYNLTNNRIKCEFEWSSLQLLSALNL